jgi:hypothetical protein
MIVDMIEALGPCFSSFLSKINQSDAKSTPEANLATPSNAARFQFGLDDLFIRDGMVLVQMVLECLLAVTNLDAGAAFWLLFVATPRLKLKMLRILVTLPIVLTVKGFVTI